MKKSAKKLAAVLLAAIICLSFSSCSAKYAEFTSFSMGSVLTARIYADENEANDIRTKITAAVSDVELKLSATDENSEISKINAASTLTVSDYTLKILEDCIVFANTTMHKADITLGALTKLWGFTGDTPSRPADSDIKSALQTVGIGSILIDEETKSVQIGEMQRLDLGAFGKGAACDAAYTVVAAANTPSVISLGGTVLIFGKNPNNKDGVWSVGIRDPFASQNDYFATLSLIPDNQKQALFISTSGSYEKCFEQDGVTYHHILDPENGMPVSTELKSVSIVSGGGFISDGLSTACFVNGLNEDTLMWLNAFSAEAVFVFEDGSYYITDGLKQSFTLTAQTGFTEHNYEE